MFPCSCSLAGILLCCCLEVCAADSKMARTCHSKLLSKCNSSRSAIIVLKDELFSGIINGQRVQEGLWKSKFLLRLEELEEWTDCPESSGPSSNQFPFLVFSYLLIVLIFIKYVYESILYFSVVKSFLPSLQALGLWSFSLSSFILMLLSWCTFSFGHACFFLGLALGVWLGGDFARVLQDKSFAGTVELSAEVRIAGRGCVVSCRGVSGCKCPRCVTPRRAGSTAGVGDELCCREAATRNKDWEWCWTQCARTK